MAEAQYVVTSGIVQQFGDKPVSDTREVGDGVVTDFTIKTLTTQSLVKISLWDDLSGIEVSKGDFAAVDGKYTVSEDGKYHNISATSIAILPGTTRAPRGDGPSKAPAQKVEQTKAPF